MHLDSVKAKAMSYVKAELSFGYNDVLVDQAGLAKLSEAACKEIMSSVRAPTLTRVHADPVVTCSNCKLRVQVCLKLEGLPGHKPGLQLHGFLKTIRHSMNNMACRGTSPCPSCMYPCPFYISD